LASLAIGSTNGSNQREFNPPAVCCQDTFCLVGPMPKAIEIGVQEAFE
jgi:hypothetical protein